MDMIHTILQKEQGTEKEKGTEVILLEWTLDLKVDPLTRQKLKFLVQIE